MHRRTLIASTAALAIAAPAFAADTDPENTIYLDLRQGRVVIRLLPDVAPKTVAQIKTLARQGFYDGTPFHRVIEGFMAQGGDPTGKGTGASKLPNVPLEASQRHFVRGVCGMARASDPDSGNSQFFIMFAPSPALDGKYTIWGQVVSGMEYVDQIKRGGGPNGIVEGEPDRIVHMRVAADVKQDNAPGTTKGEDNASEGDSDMSDAKPALDPENTLYLDLKQGRVVIQLLPDIAPMHVQQIKTLVRKGFYDGTVFHRVIEGFMAQGGNPTGTGTGGSDLDNIRAEFTDKAKFVRGACGMARSQSQHSANSQFFIMFEPASHLNGQYTIWGQVVEGMEFVDQIKRGSGGGGSVSNPDKIEKMSVAADAG